ncbi:hypothetical protein HQN64_03565 [Enterobacteriaceae bacterium BIT-l23]|uniref:Uncharacterized protein n=1 Tax=Jejubacter calystegiae TaxID=2579935 RepID=A0A4V1G8C8_9ENTR|nr:hypothetical protein [Jejubacter calystegiae]NUU65178.1 hypothetical protein [Enterobacteriaceae bacterium BIT-l23]QCT22697.1 hypothetical protein FEM41_13965 [Jejubacter calystegiae]
METFCYMKWRLRQRKSRRVS